MLIMCYSLEPCEIHSPFTGDMGGDLSRPILEYEYEYTGAFGLPTCPELSLGTHSPIKFPWRPVRGIISPVGSQCACFEVYRVLKLGHFVGTDSGTPIRIICCIPQIASSREVRAQGGSRTLIRVYERETTFVNVHKGTLTEHHTTSRAGRRLNVAVLLAVHGR